MSITVGIKNPKILGGVDSINKPQDGVVVDDLEQSEGLKSIDEVKAESPAVADDIASEAEIVKKPRRGRKSKK